MDAGGDASLQNALEVAVEALKDIPPYGHREVLFLLAALTTCDPGVGACLFGQGQCVWCKQNSGF
jgi:hypothetical protein